MFASGKPGWYPFFILLASATFFFTLISLGYDRRVFSTANNGHQHDVLSSKTINALYEDAQLRAAFLSITEQLGQTSNLIGEHLGIDSVRDFGAELADNAVELRKRQETEQNEKRGLFADLGKAVQGFVGGGGGAGGLAGAFEALLPAGLNVTGGLGGIVSRLGDTLVTALPTPALFLGLGVGMGAASGLNLSDMTTIKREATRIASAYNSSATGINLIAQNLGSGVAGQLASSFSKSMAASGGGGLAAALPGNIQIAPIAFALASGIGNATSRGLNLTQTNFQPLGGSGPEAIAGNLGLGITTPIVSNIDIKALMSAAGANMIGSSGIGASIKQMIPQIAAAAGRGLGEGVKKGLGFGPSSTPEPALPSAPEPIPSSNPQVAPAPGSNPSAAPAPASNPSAAPAPGSNPNAVPATAANPNAVPATAANPKAAPVPASNPNAAPATASNPKAAPATASNPNAVPATAANPKAAPVPASNANPAVQRRQQPDDPLQGIDLPQTVGGFVQGLSQSVLTGVNITNLGGMFNTGNLGGMFDIKAMLPGIAAGVGTGIGLGASVGLNFKSADAAPLVAKDAGMSGDNAQAAMAAQLFTQNLVSNFLVNSTVIKDVGDQVMRNQPAFLKNIKFAQAAEGFARGAVEGAMTAFSSVGGLQNLISGNFSDDSITNVPVLSPTKFDDSFNGSVVSFARGLAGEGAILAADVFKRMKQDASGTASQPRHRRSANVALAIRQAPENTMSPFPDLAVNEASIMAGAQLAVDKLTCKGIGGAASVGLGIFSSGGGASLTMLAKSQVPLDPKVTQSLPEGPIEIKSGGNTFRIVLRDADIRINGLAIIPFGIFTALHILFMILSFLIALPLYLVLGVVWRLGSLSGYPVNEAKNKRWRMVSLIFFLIFALAGSALGVIGMGNSRHFRDTHGIIGLITAILVLPAVFFSVIRLRTQIEYPTIAYFAGVKAPFSLFKTEKRVFILSGFLTQLLLSLGQILVVNGFVTLRSISLCVVDAVLSSDIVFAIAGVLLMAQLGTTGMTAVRAWLEQHIAKRQAAGAENAVILEKGEKNSVITSTIERKPVSNSGPATANLKGFADSKIGAPFNFRKEDAESDFSPPYARKFSDAPNGNPFLSPQEQRDNENNRAYNSRKTGYESTYTSAIDDIVSQYDERDSYKGRPSSELYPSYTATRPPPPPPSAPKKTDGTGAL